MGFFKKLGKKIDKGIDGVGKAISDVVSLPGEIADYVWTEVESDLRDVWNAVR